MGKRMKAYWMLIDYYKAIEKGSAMMLDAARMADWDGVTRLEGICAVLIGQLCRKSCGEALLPEHGMEKVRIMQRILQNDAQIRYLAEPWLACGESSPEGRFQVLH
jgi:flagellar protein FliT